MANPLSPFQLSKEIKEKLKDKQVLEKELAAGQSPQEILNLSEEEMAKCYRAAYLLFEEKHYEEAADAFFFLATLNSDRSDYWLGLGMSTQLQHDYEAAIDAYELAALCDLSSPVPYFYLAKCLFAIHDRESALQALNLAIETAGDSSEFSDLKIKAEEAKKMLLDQFY